eukprot:CAMPEP_0206415520 /NCGR_PEP_ID=MMETSP0294-20121207/36153_1 /ASSEMBLY_ACC=CAM_ASM_000327 /TAXON_ID=39354 /ORGANISM="Heterosigma akashiwo, Strain CCMP2393" /LENGTH=639 /DNA_ID=CAMNT_0053877905 /DNA_START=81 /DNA_END=2001 /DNA_ORIENTATION=+
MKAYSFTATLLFILVAFCNAHINEDDSLKALSPSNFVSILDDDITLKVTPDAVFMEKNENMITVSWSGVSEPCELDFLAVYSPSDALLSPGGNIETVPVQFQYLHVDPSHMQNGAGSLVFQLLNLRSDYALGLFRGGIKNPVLVAISNKVSNGASSVPMHRHLALVGDGSLTVTWVARDCLRPAALWWRVPLGQELGDWLKDDKGAEEEPHIALAETRTFTKEMLCGAPATAEGWRSPGEIFSAEMGPLVPGAVYGYRVGDLEADEWSEEAQFTAPPARGSQETVHFAIFGDMGTAMPDGSLDHMDFPEQTAALGTMSLIKSRVQTSRPIPGALASAKRNLRSTRSEAGRAAGQQEKKALDFVMHIGDISYAVGYGTHWDEFLHQIEGVASRVPWMVGIGNHERDAPGTSPARPRASHYNGTDSGGECEPTSRCRRPRATGAGTPPGTPSSTARCTWRWSPPSTPSVGGPRSSDGRGRPRADALGGPGGAPAAVRQLAVPGGSGGGRGAAGRAGAADAALRGGPGGVRPPPQLPADVPAGPGGGVRAAAAAGGTRGGGGGNDGAGEGKKGPGAPVHVVAGMAGFVLSKTFRPRDPAWIEAIDKTSHGMAFITANSTSLYFEFVESEQTKGLVDDFWLRK